MTLHESILMVVIVFCAAGFAAWYVRCLWWVFCSNMSMRWFLSDTFMGPAFVGANVFALIIASGHLVHWATN